MKALPRGVTSHSHEASEGECVKFELPAPAPATADHAYITVRVRDGVVEIMASHALSIAPQASNVISLRLAER